jgi:hypothetical protein
MKILFSILAICLTLTVFPTASAVGSPLDDELPSLSERLFDNTNALVNLSKDLTEIAKSCDNNEMAYLYSLAEKIGDILVICFYEARLLETADIIERDSRKFFFEKTKDGLERRAITGVRSNLSAIEAGSGRIRNTAAIHALDQAKQIARDALAIMNRCVAILEKQLNSHP